MSERPTVRTRSGAVTRRSLLAGAGVVGTAALVSPSLGGPRAAAQQDEFATLRVRWRELWLGSGFDPEEEPYAGKLAAIGRAATERLATLDPKSGLLWPDLGYADPDPDTDTESFGYSARMRSTFVRLREIAEAIAQPATGLTGDSAATAAVINGLEQLNAEVFGDGLDRFGNWWDFQIGSPQDLGTTAILLHQELTPEQRSAFAAAVDFHVPDSIFDSYTGISTGANRVDLCLSVILRSLFDDNADRLAVARDALSPVFPHVTEGDGYYPDGSFIQHWNIPYIGGYGAVLTNGLGRLFALLTGTSFEVTDPNRSLFLDTIDDAIAPFVFNGLMMDCVSGRGITREGSSDHSRGHGILPAIALIAKGVDEDRARRWRGMLKGWIERDDYDVVLGNNLSLVALVDLNAVQAADVEPLPEPVEHRVFHNMERATHRRPGWVAAISAASERIGHYETGNQENLRGWHTGSGWLQWWTDDTAGQYADAYWPTVDPYRLPGTTVSKKPLPDAAGGPWANPVPDAAWVGGSTDGEFGVYGQHLKGFDSTLAAYKSWFGLDDGVLCLGAGITADDDEPIETIFDNRALGETDDAALVVDGARQPGSQGWSETFDGASWAHLAGHAGYVFVRPTRLTALRDERTGSWQDINAGGSGTPITRRYLTLYADHGVRPTGAEYGCVLLPGATLAQTRAYARSLRSRLRILANTDRQQGIRSAARGLTMINFWQPGSVGDVSTDTPASTMITEHHDGTATICLSDPTRTATAAELTWQHRVTRVISAPDTLIESETGDRLRLRFGDLTGQAGATQVITVELG